jgi:hypothetical protein
MARDKPGKEVAMKTESTRFTQSDRNHDNRDKRGFLSTPFNQISEPGTSYSHDTGWLYRLPEESLRDGQNPMMSIVSKNEPRLTKISDDPDISLDKARQACADRDFNVNF